MKENQNNNFDGVIRCDITVNGVSMTMDEYEHFEKINEKISRNPWNYIVGLTLLPWYVTKMFCMAFLMGGIENKMIRAFMDDNSKLSKFIKAYSKKMLIKDKYIDEEYKRIMEVPFWERHPERYTEEYIKNNSII